MLTQTLRNMESWGLVGRKDHVVVPPNVEYSLSDIGRQLNEALDLLCGWASANDEVIVALTNARRGAA